MITQVFVFQGLCLVDWGRGIDRRLFPDNAEFKGDCRTSGFRCIEMQENKPWTFQASFHPYSLSNVLLVLLTNFFLECLFHLPPGRHIWPLCYSPYDAA